MPEPIITPPEPRRRPLGLLVYSVFLLIGAALTGGIFLYLFDYR